MGRDWALIPGRASALIDRLNHLFIIAATFVSSVIPVSAERGFPTVEILSEGNTTCGEFTTQPVMQSVRMAWVLGYISGVNAGLARNPEIAPAERMAGRSFQQPATVLGMAPKLLSGASFGRLGYCSDGTTKRLHQT